jgi:hypothetical protein
MRIFEACLNELTPFLHEPLVTAEKVDLLKARARGLPSQLAAFYLECRLSPPSPEVDVLALAVRNRPA